MIKVAVVGYGYWGPNIVRNFNSLEHVVVTDVCDKNTEVKKNIEKNYPHINFSNDYLSILKSKDIDIVAIVTPVSTHYKLAKEALLNGKHVFVEKPFTATVSQAKSLIELAEKKQLKIMVDHTFLFTGAVKKIVEIKNKESIYDLLVSYRSGDMWAPKVEQTEALKLETQYFIDCINNNSTPINDGYEGLRVVQLLEASNESLKNESKLIRI